VIGPNADRQGALFGCYSFLNHVLIQYPGVETGIEVPTVLDAMRDEFGVRLVDSRLGCGVDDDDRSGFARPSRRGRGRRRLAGRATTPDCSGAARSARGATGTTWSCPASSANWSRPCWRPARRRAGL
jgi:hypothetical protein